MSSVLYDVPGPVARRRERIFGVIAGLAILALLYFVYAQLDKNNQWDAERWQVFTDPPQGQTAEDVWTSLLVTGLGATLRAAAMGALLAIVVGTILAIGRMSPVAAIRIPFTVVIELFRGLPVVLLMFFGVIGLGLSFYWGVVFGLVLYNSAIIAEILRAGIVSLPKGQGEAGLAIGLTPMQVLFTIEMPQAVRRMLPSLISQLVVLLKDSSLGFIVGYAELLKAVQNNTQFFSQRYWFQFFVVGAAIFIAVNFTLSRIAVWLERRGTKKAAGGVAAADQVQIGGTTGTGISV